MKQPTCASSTTSKATARAVSSVYQNCVEGIRRSCELYFELMNAWRTCWNHEQLQAHASCINNAAAAAATGLLPRQATRIAAWPASNAQHNMKHRRVIHSDVHACDNCQFSANGSSAAASSATACFFKNS